MMTGMSRRASRFGREIEAVVMAALVSGACFGDSEGDSLYSCRGYGVDSPDDVAAGLEVVLPNGSEAQLVGEPMLISWRGPGASVDIELLRDGVPVLSIAEGTPNTHAYEWTPPFDLPPGADLQVRVSESITGDLDDSDGRFELRNWAYHRPLTVVSLSPTAVSDFQVLLELDSTNMDFSHAAADGADLRFATRADRAAGHDVVHFVDEWTGAGARVWVTVPELPAGGSATVHMFYGAPAATSTSSYEEVFPRRFVGAADTVLGGVQVYDVFVLHQGRRIDVAAGAPLEVRARIIEIAGMVDGAGSGDVGGSVGLAGSGLGAGGINAGGGGGGGYGGDGGAGGFFWGGWPGAGGDTHGTSEGLSIELGSGGGATFDVEGGAGGGAIHLVGHTVRVTGTLTVDGTDGGDCSSGDCGGGGSGGGILIEGHDVDIAGALFARGGYGGSGGSFGVGGGGGGGGRTKVFSSGSLVMTGVASALAGDGGSAGPDGGDGDDGTSVVGPRPATEPVVQVGSEQLLFP
jgi:hypothetical protein